MKYIIVAIIFIIFLAITVLIGMNNSMPISFNYLIAKKEMPLSTLIALVFCFGFFLAWILAFFFLLKMKVKNGLLKHKLKTLDKSVQLNKEEQKKLHMMTTKP